MKRNILILGVVVTGMIFTAFKFIKSDKASCQKVAASSMQTSTNLANDFLNLYRIPSSDDLVYRVESRYLATISKSDLNNAKNINDILPKKATESITSYNYARVSILDDFRETDQREIADSGILTTSQVNLLQSTRDSENIYIRADYNNMTDESSGLINRYLTYFMSVVPDKQAEYNDGQNSLIQYLRMNSEEQVKIIEEAGLRAGKVRFSITKNGLIHNVELISTSGYESVDKKLVELVENIPGGWTAATNENGENVDQELVFFFGLMGC